MIKLLIDHHLEGDFNRLEWAVLLSPFWKEIWDYLGVRAETLASLDLDREATDRTIWRYCQQHSYVLLTANRNNDDAHSLAATLEEENQVDSLPVFTISNVKKLHTDRAYAEAVGKVLIEKLWDLEYHLGQGRVFIP